MKKTEFAERTEHIKKRLYNTAYLYLGNEADALEALDEGIYKAIKYLKDLREEHYFETWITRIVINECNRELRRRKRVLVEEVGDEAAEMYDNLPLKEALLTLPEELRKIVILRYFTGYTLKETAEILSLPQGTVATKQRRALSLLRLELEEESYE